MPFWWQSSPALHNYSALLFNAGEPGSLRLSSDVDTAFSFDVTGTLTIEDQTSQDCHESEKDMSHGLRTMWS